MIQHLYRSKHMPENTQIMSAICHAKPKSIQVSQIADFKRNPMSQLHKHAPGSIATRKVTMIG